jgi:hypothetical protein
MQKTCTRTEDMKITLEFICYDDDTLGSFLLAEHTGGVSPPILRCIYTLFTLRNMRAATYRL